MRNAPAFLAPLFRNRTLAALLIGELAVLLAVGENVWSLSREYTSRLLMASGLNEQGLVVIQTTGHSPAHSAQESDERVERLKALPSVRAVAAINQIPFGGSSWSVNAGTEKDKGRLDTALYCGDGDLDAALGLHLLRGRGFERADFVANKGWIDTLQPASVLISTAVAQNFFGGPDAALGKTLYRGGLGPYTVIGVYERLVAPYLQGDKGQNISMLLPMTPPLDAPEIFLLRTDRTDLGALRGEVERALAGQVAAHDIESVKSFQDIRANHFATERFSLWVLASLGLAVLLTTLVGTYNTLAFWFQQRSPSLVILRALGVSDRSLHLELQLEILVIAGAAIAVGLPLAYAVNLLLIQSLHAKALALGVLLGSTLLPLLVGQLAGYLVGRKLRDIPLTRPQAVL
jgi:hypothetical protein